MSKQYLVRIGKEFLVIAALGGVATLLIFDNPVHLYEKGGWSLLWSLYWKNGVAAAILWIGNGLLTDYWDQKISWTDRPVARFWASMITTVGFTLLAWIVIVWIHVYDDVGLDFYKFLRHVGIGSFIPTLLITFFISLFMHGRAFLMEWKKALVETEQLKKEQAAARYETLKNQVNPHFLFNSLNVLSALVHIDADKAEAFIRRLSDVYRYILDSRDQDVVSLREELDILNAYFFLMDVRFGAALHTQVDIADGENRYVAPLTLQMLAENALKHNEASKANPLNIEIFIENGAYIVVRNNFQPKSIVPDSTGTGLANIRARYALLSDLPVVIAQDAQFFTVKIPLLQKEADRVSNA